jgi:erythritol transport system permease protein
MPEAPAAAAGRLKAFNVILELRAFIALIVLVIVFSFLSESYLTWDNLVTMTRHVAINALLAMGMLMVILTGGIDLSVGSIVGLAGIVAGVLLEGADARLPRRHAVSRPCGRSSSSCWPWAQAWERSTARW